MTNLYFCTTCNIVYDLNGNAPVCPKCGELLGLRREEPDNAATISEVAGWAVCGFPERRRRLWEVG